MTGPDQDRLRASVMTIATSPECWNGVTAGVEQGPGDLDLMRLATQVWPGFFVVDEGRGFIAFEPDAAEPHVWRAHIAFLSAARGAQCVAWTKMVLRHVLDTTHASAIRAIYPAKRRDVAMFCAAAGFRRVGPGHHEMERNEPCHS